MRTPEPKRYYSHVWGCQMSEHDAEKLAGQLEALGYLPAAAPEEADLLLYETCSVRDKAAEKFYSELGTARKLKREKPDLLIVVGGCVAQHDREYVLERAPHVDVVLGTRGTNHLGEAIQKRLERQSPQVDMRRYMDAIHYDPALIRRKSAASAYITVQEGCSKVCTFCIVPTTRGAELNRPFADIVDEARMLAGRGYREVRLLGQNVNAWRHEGRDFADLLDAVARVPGLARVRFSTSYPGEFTEKMMDVMAAHDTIPKALHLPVQSGSNAVLRRMRRFYTREEYLEKARLLRRKMPLLTFSTDVIVGFPGETDADFEDTMSLVREVGFEWMYSFKYSPREGTPAAHWEADFVPPDVAQDRLARLQAMQHAIQEEALRRELGRRVPVLVEGPSKKSPRVVAGRSDRNFVVNFEGDETLTGRIVPVRVTRAMPNSLWGEALTPAEALLAGAGG